MKEFFFYDDDGRVVMYGMCGDGEVELQTMPGYHRGEGKAMPGVNRIVEGAITDLPQKPGEFYDFDYSGGEWVYKEDWEWDSIRERRDRELARTDWTTSYDSPLTQSQGAEAVAYRQALRDITEVASPADVIWPEVPGFLS